MHSHRAELTHSLSSDCPGTHCRASEADCCASTSGAHSATRRGGDGAARAGGRAAATACAGSTHPRTIAELPGLRGADLDGNSADVAASRSRRPSTTVHVCRGRRHLELCGQPNVKSPSRSVAGMAMETTDDLPSARGLVWRCWHLCVGAASRSSLCLLVIFTVLMLLTGIVRRAGGLFVVVHRHRLRGPLGACWALSRSSAGGLDGECGVSWFEFPVELGVDFVFVIGERRLVGDDSRVATTRIIGLPGAGAFAARFGPPSTGRPSCGRAGRGVDVVRPAPRLRAGGHLGLHPALLSFLRRLVGDGC